MRFILFFSLFFTLVTFTRSALLFEGGATRDTITLRTDYWCPYACTPGDKPGYMIEIAKAVFESKGYKIDYDIEPWARAVKDVSEGKYLGLVGTAKVDAPTLLYPQITLGNNRSCFYSIQGKLQWKYRGEESLKEISFAAIKDYTYGDPVDTYIKKNPGKVDVIAGNYALALNIAKVLAGRIDAVIENESVIAMHLKEKPIKKPFGNYGCVEGDPVFIGFYPRHPNAIKYAEMLTNGIIELRKNGKLKEILNRYGIDDWEKK
ncbi:MAG: transporter substrate-binding domain-containing protein [Oligoflexia bacterium]|nr:transporter substrate-binding domain-containing protein [Oligoflexia bacterium]